MRHPLDEAMKLTACALWALNLFDSYPERIYFMKDRTRKVRTLVAIDITIIYPLNVRINQYCYKIMTITYRSKKYIIGSKKIFYINI